MPEVNANGITIHYEEAGQGDPILLIMGLGGQLIDWSDDFVAELVARNFRVIRLDNRDSGLSSEHVFEAPPRWKTVLSILTRRKPTTGYDIGTMAADSAGLLDALGIDSAHIAGASMGGMIAQSMAINHPEKVRSLTPIMSNTGDGKTGGIDRRIIVKFLRHGEPDSVAEAAEHATEMYSWWAGSSWDRAEHLARAEQGIARSYRPEAVVRQTAAIAASPDRTEALGRVTAPTLVIHGLEDKLVVPSGGTATCEAIPGSRLLMFPDMGHDLPRTRWAEVADGIRTNADRAKTGTTA